MNRRSSTIGSVLVIISLVAGIGLFDNHMSPHTHTSQKSAVLGSYDERSWAKVEVSKIERLESNPTSQTTHYRLSAKVTNMTSEVIQFSPGLQASIHDERGIAYPTTAHYTEPETVIGGPITANTSWEGRLDFDIEDSHTPKLFVLERDAQSIPIEVTL